MKEENDLDVIFGGGGSVGDFDELSMLSPPSSQDNQRLQEHGRITTFKLSNQVTKKAVTFTLEALTIKSKSDGKTTLKGKLVDWVESGLFLAVLMNEVDVGTEDWYLNTIDGVEVSGWYLHEIFVSDKKVCLKVQR